MTRKTNGKSKANAGALLEADRPLAPTRELPNQPRYDRAELSVLYAPKVETTGDLLRMLEHDLPDALWLLLSLLPDGKDERVSVAKALAYDVRVCIQAIYYALSTGRRPAIYSEAGRSGADVAEIAAAAAALGFELGPHLGMEGEALATLARILHHAVQTADAGAAGVG